MRPRLGTDLQTKKPTRSGKLTRNPDLPSSSFILHEASPEPGAADSPTTSPNPPPQQPPTALRCNKSSSSQPMGATVTLTLLYRKLYTRGLQSAADSAGRPPPPTPTRTPKLRTTANRRWKREIALRSPLSTVGRESSREVCWLWAANPAHHSCRQAERWAVYLGLQLQLVSCRSPYHRFRIYVFLKIQR